MRQGELPAKKFLCVYSEERLENKGFVFPGEPGKSLSQKTINGEGDPGLVNHDWSTQKAVINGTVAHITAIFGFTLAGLVIESIYRQK